jgi:hemerythrin-like domain-containing protein
MYTILDKIIDEKEAKRKLIGVLQEEIKYIQSTDEDLKETQDLIDELKAHRQHLSAYIKKETDEGKKFEAMEAYHGLDAFIKYIDE